MFPRETWHLPTRRLGRRVLIYDSVGSTNDVAVELAQDRAEIGTAILADEQTAGRGQFGRSWHCPPGTAVQLSLILDPPTSLCRPAFLTAWAAVAVAETVRKLTNIPARIKWPNDVLLQGRKIAGLLIERKTLVILGIGLNVNQSAEQFFSAGLLEAGSLASVTGRSLDRDSVAKQLLIELDADYTALLDGELATLAARWAWHIGLLGRRVTIERLNGSCLHGRLRELTLDRLVLEPDDGTGVCIAPEAVRQLRSAEKAE